MAKVFSGDTLKGSLFPVPLPLERFSTWLIIALAALLWLVNARSRGVESGGAIPLLHYVIASGAPVFFGMAFVFRKWGLERFDSAVIGAFVGALSAYIVIVLIDAVRGMLAERARSNFKDVSWWFVAAGVATSVALLSQFLAFTYLEACSSRLRGSGRSG